MKFKSLVLYSSTLFLASAVQAVDLGDNSKLTIQNNFLYNNNHISGARPSGSFLTPGDNFVEDLGLLFTAKKGATKWEGAADGRFSDDERIEKKLANLKRFFIKGDNSRRAVVVGDFLGSFSQYSLNTSLKGARYTEKFTPKMELSILSGLSKSQWADLWENKDTESLDRVISGARFSTSFLQEGFLGLHTVQTNDTRAKGNNSATTTDQTLSGIEWALPVMANFRIRGESAYADTQQKAPSTLETDQQGWAHQLKADFRYRRFSTQNEFERVSPEFITAGGAAVSDLIRARTQNRLKLGGLWTILANYTWFHNNLRNDVTQETTRTIIPEAGLRAEGPDARPNLFFELKGRLRQRETAIAGTTSRTRSLMTSLGDRLGPANVNVDYELQDEDKSDGSLDATHHIIGVGFNSLHKFSPFKLVPSLRWNLQRDRDNSIGKTDENNLINAGLLLQAVCGFDLGGTYTRNYAQNDVAAESDRRSLSASAGYNWKRNKDQRVEVRFRQNDNRFEAATQNFKEAIWEAELKNRF